MGNYYYRIIDSENKVQTGTVYAIARVHAQMRIEQLFVGATVLVLARQTSLLSLLAKIEVPFLTRAMTGAEEIVFYRNFASMLGVGLPMSSTLGVLADQARSEKMKKVLAELQKMVENGKPLSASMLAHPKHFPEHICETLRVGEATGNMVPTLDQISTNLERDYEISRKVIGAITYPLVVMAVLILVAGLLITMVLPKIVALFEEMNAELPIFTRILVGIGNILSEHPLELAVLFVATVAISVSTYRTEKGKYVIHGFFLKTPIFGELIKEYNQVRFFRAMKTLFASGIALAEASEISVKTMRNTVYQKAIRDSHEALLRGTKLSETLMQYPSLYNLQTRRMLEIGEQAGKYDETFDHLTKHFERSVHYRVQIMNSVLEPILILIVGAVIGGLALSIFMPIYSASEVI
jgi:type IV pilus assembly protein PilC